jgi:P pilus assembly chaperone PapD
MKKNIFIGLFSILVVLAGVMFSGCDVEELEDGIGTLKVTNNSNVRITYVSLENGGSTVSEAHVNIYPGSSTSLNNAKTGFYTVYVEDSDGDGYVTKSSVTIKKDATTEVKFPGDFKVSN